jgi:hypothetical protein
MYQRAMFGEVTHDSNKTLVDLTAREIAILVPVVLVIVWIGVYPQPFLQRLEASTRTVVERVTPADRARATQTTPAAECPELSPPWDQTAWSESHGEASPPRPCRKPPTSMRETGG